MKIALKTGQESHNTVPAAQDRALEADVLSVKSGDWSANQRLVRQFLPLITSSAQRRTTEAAGRNTYVEAGKLGLIKAAKKYKAGDGAHMFRVSVVDFIESAMDRADKGSLLERLFGRK